MTESVPDRVLLTKIRLLTGSKASPLGFAPTARLAKPQEVARSMTDTLLLALLATNNFFAGVHHLVKWYANRLIDDIKSESIGPHFSLAQQVQRHHHRKDGAIKKQ